MRRFLRMAVLCISWVAAALFAAVEAILTVSWARGMLYLTQVDPLENPYAVEDTEIMGICALFLLPLFLAALAWAVYETVKVRAKGRQDRSL